MGKEKPLEASPPPPAKPDPRAPLVPRFVITLITLVLVGIMGYAATQHDYRSMIVAALVVLFILGADIGAMVRGWRGGSQ